MSEQELYNYFSSKGYTGKALSDIVAQHLNNKSEPQFFNSEETDKGLVSQRTIDLNDEKFKKYQKYLQDRGRYNVGFLGGVATGIARQLPLTSVVTDITDNLGLTDKWGVGPNEEINDITETSSLEFTSDLSNKLAKGANPIQKNKNWFEKKISSNIGNVGKLGKAAKYTKAASKLFGVTDRLIDGAQFIDHVSNYNPPKESDYYKYGGKINYLQTYI